MGFTHLPLQQISEYLHFFPHFPQLSLSVDTFTHFFLQQSRPGLPLTRQILGYLSHVMKTRAFLAARKRLVPRREVCSCVSAKGRSEISLVMSSSSLRNVSSLDVVAERVMIIAMRLTRMKNIFRDFMFLGMWICVIKRNREIIWMEVAKWEWMKWRKRIYLNALNGKNGGMDRGIYRENWRIKDNVFGLKRIKLDIF